MGGLIYAGIVAAGNDTELLQQVLERPDDFLRKAELQPTIA
jgi:hypothetical protein